MTTTDAAALGMAELVRIAVLLLELAGTLSILAGAAIATTAFVRSSFRTGYEKAYGPFRAGLGRSILLGLEFLVAGDILKSLVIDPTFDALIVLASLILVRTFLSLSLGVEINGHWPWQETRLGREAANHAREDSRGGVS